MYWLSDGENLVAAARELYPQYVWSLDGQAVRVRVSWRGPRLFTFVWKRNHTISYDISYMANEVKQEIDWDDRRMW